MSDLIRRSDVIATIGVMYERCDTYDITDYRDLMLESVKVLPSADRPSGEWIDDIEAESNGYYWANCSQCGLQIDVHENRGYYNYCPHCGARMKGADDEITTV